MAEPTATEAPVRLEVPTRESVPTGNAYDKYGSANPLVRLIMAGFFGAIDQCLPARPPASILEVGLGEGEVSIRAGARWPASRLVGIDLPDPGLAVAWRGAGLAAAFADITQLPFPDRSFELVVAVEVLEHVRDPGAGLAELTRVADRHVVLSVPREPVWRAANLARGRYVRAIGNTPGHVHHWSKRAFQRLVAGQLEVDHVCSPFPWTVIAAHRR